MGSLLSPVRLHNREMLEMHSFSRMEGLKMLVISCFGWPVTPTTVLQTSWTRPHRTGSFRIREKSQTCENAYVVWWTQDYLCSLYGGTEDAPLLPKLSSEQVSVRSLMTEADKHTHTPDSIKPALFSHCSIGEPWVILWAVNCFILLDETHAHTRRTVTLGSVWVGCDRVDGERAWLWQDALTLSAVVAAWPLSAVPERPVVTKTLTDLQLTLRPWHIYSIG